MSDDEHVLDDQPQPAPEFPDDLDWLNTRRPIRLSELRGKFVLLDFWTYGCINCLHMIPRLHELAQQFREELVVIGVHSGKYANERRTPHLHDALHRLGVDHPVLNDRKFRTWRAYDVQAWPTLVLLDPDGNYIGSEAGESTVEQWTLALYQFIAQAEIEGRLKRAPLLLDQITPEPRRVLRYPEKVLADDQGRLFIADTGHNRIIVAQLDGDRARVTQVIGSGAAGRIDGHISFATFNQPRGMALIDQMLYVADTANHLIRSIELPTGTVLTVAGTGERGEDPQASGPGGSVALASPWDLLPYDNKLVIAMAGSHQLWLLDPGEGTLAPLAGSGYEGIDDGPLVEATLAQPSGVASDGSAIYVVDAESQAVRRVTPGADGAVTTIVGTGLFDSGDKDGVGDEAVLQHPQALAWHAGQLYVADTYNHKIKIVDPATRACRTWLGARRIDGFADGAADQAAFYEPGGLSVANTTLYIADTNNHAIRAADLTTGVVRTIEIEGLEPI